ncbi:hypothetical protein [Sphingomonas hylomeconis]|uniref:Uncharacterized protein n=1 Tax=Sphingomonas hylomeconis TaxID=1395958 RepID=A0ABV7SQ01_9SPHN|nr:hypothetical protein [Sphingomonas hylomeconis]
MGAAKTLNIVNYFDAAVDVAVTNNNFNCCDSPQPGQSIGNIAPNRKASFTYQRTDGHGCNGRQGQFQLSFESNYTANLDFDGDANLELSDVPTNFGAYLSQNSDGNYSLVVGDLVGG